MIRLLNGRLKASDFVIKAATVTNQEMALGVIGKFNKTGDMGNSPVSFVLDDFDLQVTGIRATNNDSRNLIVELHDSSGVVLNTFTILPGTSPVIDFSPSEKIPYEIKSVGRDDGTTKQTLEFYHRIYFQ